MAGTGEAGHETVDDTLVCGSACRTISAALLPPQWAARAVPPGMQTIVVGAAVLVGAPLVICASWVAPAGDGSISTGYPYARSMKLLERLDIYEKLMRLDKPIGALLLLWPTLWGLWLSSFGNPDPMVVVVFVIGVVLMRSAGCVINDFADRDFDPLVERTKDRPLAAKRISPKEALLLAGILLVIAFTLVLQFNELTIKLSLAACLLAVIYPFLKRFFWLPQAWLGIAFGFGIPMAYAVHREFVPPVAWALVVANMLWVIAYDTEYAMVDRDDDIKLGLRSSAILFGKFDVLAVMVCHAMFFGLMAYIGYWVRLGVFFYAGLLLATGFAFWQYQLIRGRNRADCFKAFLGNNWMGAAVFAGMAADFLFFVPLFHGAHVVITR
jgi:4-hydroxybenzoate polyprenyltransferase